MRSSIGSSKRQPTFIGLEQTDGPQDQLLRHLQSAELKRKEMPNFPLSPFRIVGTFAVRLQRVSRRYVFFDSREKLCLHGEKCCN